MSFLPTCNGADSDVCDQTFYEFPILKDGTVLSAGRTSRTDVGTDRVAFLIGATLTAPKFCGIMTHFTDEKVDALIGDVIKKVLPSRLC